MVIQFFMLLQKEFLLGFIMLV